MIFVFDATLNHAARIARVADKEWGDRASVDRRNFYGAVSLAKVAMESPLVWKGMEIHPLG